MSIRIFRNIFINDIFFRSEEYIEGNWTNDTKHKGNIFRERIIHTARNQPYTKSEAPWLLDINNTCNLAGGSGHIFFVIEENNIAMGYRDIIWDGKSKVYSQYTWVVPCMRGKGIGTLLDKALCNIVGHGVFVYLWAREGRALQFWRNRGYEETGNLKKDKVILHEMKKII